jgi:hypothetical protein
MITAEDWKIDKLQKVLALKSLDVNGEFLQINSSIKFTMFYE